MSCKSISLCVEKEAAVKGIAGCACRLVVIRNLVHLTISFPTERSFCSHGAS
jgi:hypothetical protein